MKEVVLKDTITMKQIKEQLRRRRRFWYAFTGAFIIASNKMVKLIYTLSRKKTAIRITSGQPFSLRS
jgi:hypothetical protein